MKAGDQKDSFLIVGFLRNILNKEEAREFQKRMNDEAFQDKVSHETVNQNGRIQLNSKLDDIHQVVVQEQNRQRIYKLLLFSILAILVAVGGWRLVSDGAPPMKTDLVFANYFAPYPSLFEQKGEVSSREEIGFAEAMKAYSTQDYSNSIRQFEAHLGQSETKMSLPSFYYGIALLANGQSDQALKIFKSLKDESKSNALLPKEPIHWYLALAYIEVKNYEAALPLLDWVASRKKGSFKQQEAKEILEILEN